MIYVAEILVLFVALLHLYFLALEMFFWTKPLGLKAFRNTLEKAKITEVLAKNQGLYNGFLAAGLIWGCFHPETEVGFQIQFFFLTCVMIAGLYGAYTVSKKILYVQFGPALLAMAAVMATTLLN